MEKHKHEFVETEILQVSRSIVNKSFKCVHCGVILQEVTVVWYDINARPITIKKILVIRDESCKELSLSARAYRMS